MADEPKKEALDQNAQGQLRAFIERVEKVEVEQAEQREFKKEIYAEAKGAGYDVPALKAVIRLRRLDPAKRQEFDAIVDLYSHAAGI